MPPALTKTMRPARSDGPSAPSTAAAMTSGSAILPMPTSPLASGPSTGPTSVAPRSRNEAALACVAGCRHIRWCMAGASTSGPSKQSRVAVSASSANPCAARASKFAVAGATASTSAQAARSTCTSPA